MNKSGSGSGEKIRVLIVDDHAMVRQGLRTFLELQDASALPIEVTEEAANGIQAVELARNMQPDIVLLDLVMPEMDGIQATPKIIECSPRSRVIILTSFGEEDKVLPAIRAGAQGYLLKDIPPHELVQAVREVCLGRVQLHPEIAKKLMAAVAAKKEESATSHAVMRTENGLTEREQEVLHLITDGMFVEKALMPNIGMVRGLVELDPQGRIVIDIACRTNIPGLFAADRSAAGC